MLPRCLAAIVAGRDEDAQSVVEYGLVIAMIALVVIGVLSSMGDKLPSLFCPVVTTLGSACP